MLSKKTVFLVSVVVSLALHGVLFAVAPSVFILRRQSTQDELMRTFRVNLADPEIQPFAMDKADAGKLSSRPGDIKDMLKREKDDMALNESLLNKKVDIPGLENRLIDKGLERDYDLSQDQEVLKKIDSRIIEIAQEDARKDIEVARRLVRPSPQRILAPDEFPTLRGKVDDENALSKVLSLPAVKSSLKETATEKTPQDQAEKSEPGTEEPPQIDKPPYEEDVLEPEVIEPARIALPIEHKVTHEPVIQEAREESEYEFIDELVDIQIDTYLPSGQVGEGFFQLKIIPKQTEDIEVLPKDVTFIVDASSSILPRKLDRTARGIREMVDELRPEDHFNIVVFRDSGTWLSPEAVPATAENRQAAIEFLDALEPRGQTDVYKAIRPVLEKKPREGVPGIVLVMTDGRPTTGVRDGRTIINALTAENEKGNTIFAYGGGNTVNRYLLDLLAYRNRGDSYVSNSINEIDEELPEFFKKLRDPLLVSLRADYGGINELDVYPKEIPDFYRDRVVTVYGRFDPQEAEKEFSMRLAGRAQDSEKELIFKANLQEAATGDSTIAREWAKKKIYYLIGELCRVGEKPELLSELRRLSRKYGIKTSYSEDF